MFALDCLSKICICICYSQNLLAETTMCWQLNWHRTDVGRMIGLFIATCSQTHEPTLAADNDDRHRWPTLFSRVFPPSHLTSSILGEDPSHPTTRGSEPLNRIWDHWTSVLPKRGRKEPLENIGVPLWTRLRWRRVWHKDRQILGAVWGRVMTTAPYILRESAPIRKLRLTNLLLPKTSSFDSSLYFLQRSVVTLWCAWMILKKDNYNKMN